MGDSRDPATTMSALIHPIHVERVLGFIDRARAASDTIVRGGKLRKEGANWIEPTLIVPKSNDSEGNRIAQACTEKGRPDYPGRPLL